VDYFPLIAAQGWACGVNAYLSVVVLGLAGRLGLADTPHGLQQNWVIAAALAMYLVEFVVDKIPYLDSLWDTVHTAIRPAVAAAVGALTEGRASSPREVAAAATSALVALASHAVKAGIRLGVNASPEPFSNMVVSTGEDGAVVGVVGLALAHPWVAFGVVLVLLGLGGLLLAAVARAVRRGLRRLRARRAARTGAVGDPHLDSEG
jgi:hypothetical protein